jgi:hypothetical protein
MTHSSDPYFNQKMDQPTVDVISDNVRTVINNDTRLFIKEHEKSTELIETKCKDDIFCLTNQITILNKNNKVGIILKGQEEDNQKIVTPDNQTTGFDTEQNEIRKLADEELLDESMLDETTINTDAIDSDDFEEDNKNKVETMLENVIFDALKDLTSSDAEDTEDDIE